jgi:hypothetical protein
MIAKQVIYNLSHASKGFFLCTCSTLEKITLGVQERKLLEKLIFHTSGNC